jgi:ankyrin repeat protein
VPIGLVAALLATATTCSDDRAPSTSGPTATHQADQSAPQTPQSSAAPSPATTTQPRLDAQLIRAAWDNDVPRARRLIRAGASVNHRDGTQQSAYLIASSEGYVRLLELTLAHGADVASLDSFAGTGLIRAADRGHAFVAGRLLRAGVDVDHVNNLGWTALHEAIILGNGSRRYVSTVRVLVAGGADVELPSRRDGVAPLDHARSAGHGAIVRTLRAALDGAPVPDPDAALLRAASSGNADRAALALRAGADIETRDRHRRTPLLLAAANDRPGVARLLVALGADPDALDDRHDTPWLVTGVTGSVPMLEILLPAKPDLTIRNRFGGTSLIPASERGHVDYVRRAVRTRIDVDHVNDLGWTALLEAVILGDGSEPYRDIVRLLLDAGADRSIPDRNGVTAIEHARAEGQDRIARILAR